jgi:hypothetical protein
MTFSSSCFGGSVNTAYEVDPSSIQIYESTIKHEHGQVQKGREKRALQNMSGKDKVSIYWRIV